MLKDVADPVFAYLNHDQPINGDCENYEGVSLSPFRLRRGIGPRPAFTGADAMGRWTGAAPFADPSESLNFLVGFDLGGQVRFRRMKQRCYAIILQD